MAVHVVDNASGDGTAAMVEEEFPWVDLEVLDWNSGFAFANDVALRRTSAEFALVLNPDTSLEDGVLDHMLGLMRERPEVGIATCRLARLDGTLDHASKTSFPTPLGALADFTGIGRQRWAGRSLAQYRTPHLDEFSSGQVDSVSGALCHAGSAGVRRGTPSMLPRARCSDDDDVQQGGVCRPLGHDPSHRCLPVLRRSASFVSRRHVPAALRERSLEVCGGRGPGTGSRRSRARSQRARDA